MNGWEALQRAIVLRLKTWPGLAELDERVYDQVPREPAPPKTPYLDLGIARLERERSFGCGKLFNVVLRLFVVADDFGRLRAWRILMAAEEALEAFEPQLEGGHACTSLQVAALQDSADPLRPIEAHLTVSTLLTISD